MVIWQAGSSEQTVLPHFYTIAGELRTQIEHKLLALWHLAPVHAPAFVESRGAVRERVNGERVNGDRHNGERLNGDRLGGERVHSGHGPRVA